MRRTTSVSLLHVAAVGLAAVLAARAAAAVCGDGVVAGTEQCDDGAANGTDGCCTADCHVLDVDGDGLCDAKDGCNFGPNSAIVKESHLRVSRLATPPGDDRLTFTGVLTLPVVPAIDPGADGFRVTVFTEPVAGYHPAETSVVFDLLVPGGPHWTRHGGRAWQYRDPAGTVGGVTRIAVKLRAPILPTAHLADVVFTVQASRGRFPITPAMATSSEDAGGQWHGNALFAEVSLAAGPGVITSQCGIQTYSSTLNAPDVCDFDPRGSAAECHGPPPVGPCHVGDPTDLVFCDIVDAARAEDAYFGAHGTYFTGPCSGMPGFVGSPTVTCTATGTTTGYVIADSDPRMRLSTGCTWSSASAQNPSCS